MSTVKIMFQWNIYRPDNRSYKQQSMELQPINAKRVMIDLPTNLLVNAEEVLLAEMSNSEMPEYVLSLDAVKYLVDEWEKVFSDPNDEEEYYKELLKDNDWDEVDTSTPIANDDWDEADTATPDANDNWDDSTNDETDDWGESNNESDETPWDDNDWDE